MWSSARRWWLWCARPGRHLRPPLAKAPSIWSKAAMCNRARLDGEPETLREKFGAKWGPQIPNRTPIELVPRAAAPVVRSAETQRIIDLMRWDVLGGQAKWPMTNV